MSKKRGLSSLLGKSIIDQTGAKLGKVSAIYVDTVSEEPQWLSVHAGLLGRNEYLVPMASVTVDADELVTTYTKQLVEDAPGLDGDSQFSSDEEADLFRYYGMNYFQGGLTGAAEVSAVEAAEDVANGQAASRLRKYSPEEGGPTTVPVAHGE